jgi:uncharacterized protein YbbC (DUF1343 family)
MAIIQKAMNEALFFMESLKIIYKLYFCRMKNIFLFLLLASLQMGAQPFSRKVITGASQMDVYLPLIQNKKVALLVNQTSVVGDTHLVDTLLSAGVEIVKIFAPEHGFRGTADAGEKVKSGMDTRTGLPITSMYGASKKPSKESMAGIDVVIFDIQDVGARFYTYISSLQYMMEACAASGAFMIVLDRPNPNGHYVDGPVLEKKHRSFVGMQAIPIVHGMTVGEYANMLKGEKWLNTNQSCSLKVITCLNYDHRTLYQVTIPPSPNLKSMSAIWLYPSLCLFEGTIVSVGRGTPRPFEVWGHPSFKNNGFSFTPKSVEGAKNPLYENQTCYGANLKLPPSDILKIVDGKLNLSFILNAYSLCKNKATFFNDFFIKLSGTELLKKQITQGVKEQEIRKSWLPGLKQFKKIRKKYLLYADFE